MQLQNEIRITMGFEVEHENIIQPVGYCFENEEVAVQYNYKMYITYPIHAALCLEYMENGSLREHISGRHMQYIHISFGFEENSNHNFKVWI